MKTEPRESRKRLLPRLLAGSLAAGLAMLSAACETPFSALTNQEVPSHAQQITVFLEDIAREALAAFLF